MNKRQRRDLPEEIAAPFAKGGMQLLEQMNGGALMLPADFERLRPPAGAKVQRELPRVWATYRAARRDVEAGKVPAVLPVVVIAANAMAIAVQVWSEYQKASRGAARRN